MAGTGRIDIQKMNMQFEIATKIMCFNVSIVIWHNIFQEVKLHNITGVEFSPQTSK